MLAMVGTTPIIDDVQEFKVQSHNDSSAYGYALGGIVNVATKSGTNEYHGDGWEFVRNNVFDARNFFIANTIPYKQNQFGGVIGGPLLPRATSAAGRPRLGSLRAMKVSGVSVPLQHCWTYQLRQS